MRVDVRLRRFFMTAFCFTFAMLAARDVALGAAQQKLRPAGVAGSFYPADPAALKTAMDEMMARATQPAINGQILAVIAPHAGYQYSGPVAAYSFAALKGRKYSRVVVIAPSHYEAFDFTSVYNGDGYVTPLGTVPVDKEFAQKLTKMSSSIRFSDRGHAATAKGAEHALEVQLPWLQRVLGSFTLVPIIMGDQSYESSRALGLALAKLIQVEDGGSQKGAGGTLIVASSDLSHYHTYAEAEKIDHKTLNALQAWDYFSMSRNFQSRVWEACGGAPIVAAMIAVEHMGANQAKLLRYANSGDVTGDRSYVVGYSAVALVKAPGQQATEKPYSLTDQEKSALLSVAQKSVTTAVRDQRAYDPGNTVDQALSEERGAFVTIKENGDLRGCVGYTSPVKPLYLTVRDTAIFAALRDPRFRPVSVQELPKLEYEISVLSPLRHVQDVREIVVGKHGLYMKNGNSEGLLLPQVAVDEHWDRTKFLEQTCGKAGMQPNCWKEDGTDIFVFTAVVFGEHRTASHP